MLWGLVGSLIVELELWDPETGTHTTLASVLACLFVSYLLCFKVCSHISVNFAKYHAYIEWKKKVALLSQSLRP
jgi:hypothetical protein